MNDRPYVLPTDIRGYSAKQVAEMFGVTKGTVLGWLRSGKLKGGKLNGTTWRVPQEEVQRLAREMYGEKNAQAPVD